MPMKKAARLVALGLVLTFVFSGAVQARKPLLEPQPNSDRILVSTPGHRASEYMAVSDPRRRGRVVAAAIDLDTPVGGFQCNTWFSKNGGRTWRESSPTTLWTEGYTADPWLSIDERGRVHLVCLQRRDDQSDDRLVTAIIYLRSDDFGKSWSEPMTIQPSKAPDALASADKISILVSSKGTIFVCATEGGNPNLVVERSDNGGETWEGTELKSEDSYLTQCNGIVEGPNGEIHINAVAYDGNFGTYTSYDDGRTWGGFVVAGNRRPGGRDQVKHLVRGFTQRVPLYPDIAVSPRTGSVFVSSEVLQEDDTMHTLVYRSTDRGQSYQPVSYPVPPSDLCASGDILKPAAAVDRRGIVGLHLRCQGATWFQTGREESWFSASADDGNSWSKPLLVSSTDLPSTNLDPRNWGDPNSPLAALLGFLEDPSLARGENLLFSRPYTAWRFGHAGDYWFMTASNAGFVVMWVDAFNGIQQVWARLIKV